MTDTRDTPEATHHEVRGTTMEPDPANPGLMRQTAFCPFCAAHRPDEDPRWPCETARFEAEIERGQREIGRLRRAMQDALPLPAFEAHRLLRAALAEGDGR